MKTYAGGCHCGAVRFEIDSALDEVIVCNCSVCTKKGFLHVIVEGSAFRLLQGEDALTTYTFGTHTAKHLFCKTCGIGSYYVPRSHPDGFSVNARCLDGVDLSSLPIKGFDGRHWEENIAGLQRGEP